MLKISNLLTTSRYLPLTRLWLQLRCFCSPSPSSLSSSSSLSVPSDDHIVRLILDQKSASKALETFQWASTFPGFIHSRSTYRALFHKLCIFRRFETVYQLLDEMPGLIGLPPDDAIFITIIRGFGRARLTKQVISVVDLVSKFGIKPSLKVFNSILDVLVKEDIDIAREFFRRKMMATGIQGDEYTYGILMKGLCLTNRIADGFKLLQFMKTRGLAPNTVIYNTLLHALCKNEKVGRARSLMSEMKQPNDVTFNILISAYCNEQKLIQSMVLLEKCFNLGLVPDVVTITKVMEVLCNEGRVSEALEVLERVESCKGGKVDVVACNTLVKGYCKLGKVRVAQRFFKEMERKGYLPNVETYNLLIAGFCDVGMLDSALETYNDMKTDAVRSNFATFNTLIKGLSVGGRVDDGLKILELMQDSETVRGARIDPYNSVIYGFYKENRWEEALKFLVKMEKMFPRAVERSFKLINLCEKGGVDDVKTAYDEMVGEGGVPNVIVSHCLIHRYSQEKKDYMEETWKLINEMVTRGYLPQSSTFNAVIIGFCKQDRVMNGIKFVEDMAERGCVPDGESYKPLLQELCVKGDFQKGCLVFSRMVEKSIVPDSSMWSSLMFCLSQKTEFHLNTLLEDIIQT